MKFKKMLALFAAAALSLGIMSGCGSSDSSAADTGSTAESSASDTGDDAEAPLYTPTGEIRDISSWELVKEMKVGWNLGNTMDATGENGLGNETAWQPVQTSEYMVKLLKDSGFNVMRVPVSWGDHVDENYQIDEAWLKRVHEIVDYGMANDMFVILNTHHEEWYFPDGKDKEQDEAQLKAIWEQIADEFKDYDEHLIFEGLNEPRLRGTGKEWTGGDKTSREVVNEYERVFYDTVRNSGGNNAKRHLMITGYAASSSRNCLEAIQLPENDDKLIVSVHAYLPYSFALDTKGTGVYDPENSEIPNLFSTLDDLFISKQIPVIVGEFGSVNKDNIDDRIACVTDYLTAAKELGIPCVWWDNNAVAGGGENFGLMDRSLPPGWYFPQIVEAIQNVYA